ncbi:hypothetical protein Tco_1524751 [Tanacetum coccineum]
MKCGVLSEFSQILCDFSEKPAHLGAITDQLAGSLPSDTVKNTKLNTSPVLSARSYPTEDQQCSTQIHSSINAITICPKQPNKPQNDESGGEDREKKKQPKKYQHHPPSPHDPSISFIIEKVRKLNLFLESSGWVPQSSDTEIVCTKGDDGEVMFIEIIRKNDDSSEERPKDKGGTTIERLEIMRRKLDPKENTNRGVSNFIGRIKGMHVFVGNFTYVPDFIIVEDISSIIDPRLSQVVLGKPFVDVSNMTHDPPKGVVKFINGTDEIAYKIPHKIEQYKSLSNLEKEHTKLVYLRNEEDKRRGVEYVMSKILGFYKECLELRSEYATGMDDEGEVTLYLTRRSLEVLRKFSLDDYWRMI